MKKPAAHFSKAPKMFQASKPFFSSSVSKNGEGATEVYTPETSSMKGTSVHRENMNSFVIISFENLLLLCGCENLAMPLRKGRQD